MSGPAGGALAARPAERIPADGLRRVHVGMIDAVVAGESLAHVAGLAAQQLGGRVAIVLPGLDLAVIEPGPADTALAAVRRYVAERPRGGPVDLPEGLVAEAVVRSGEERLGSVALLDAESGPNAADVLQLAALAALTAVTLDQDERVTRRRASASLLDDLHAGDVSHPAELLARATRLGCDLRAGAAALCVRPGPGAAERVLATIEQEFLGALVAVRGHTVEALLPAAGSTASEEDARRLARRLRRHAPTGLAPFEPELAGVPTALRIAALSLALGERARPRRKRSCSPAAGACCCASRPAIRASWTRSSTRPSGRCWRRTTPRPRRCSTRCGPTSTTVRPCARPQRRSSRTGTRSRSGCSASTRSAATIRRRRSGQAQLALGLKALVVRHAVRSLAAAQPGPVAAGAAAPAPTSLACASGGGRR